jgi:ribosome biogenesis SPOUT family RNA methylase Rps3
MSVFRENRIMILEKTTLSFLSAQTVSGKKRRHHMWSHGKTCKHVVGISTDSRRHLFDPKPNTILKVEHPTKLTPKQVARILFVIVGGVRGDIVGRSSAPRLIVSASPGCKDLQKKQGIEGSYQGFICSTPGGAGQGSKMVAA